MIGCIYKLCLINPTCSPLLFDCSVFINCLQAICSMLWWNLINWILLRLEGELTGIILASALLSIRCDWIIAVSLGCPVSLRTSSFRTNWCHLMPNSIVWTAPIESSDLLCYCAGEKCWPEDDDISSVNIWRRVSVYAGISVDNGECMGDVVEKTLMDQVDLICQLAV